jgi:hypothetical protein
VYRHFLTVFAALAAALLLVPSALALRVHVRVEGKTRTIYGATEPTLSVQLNPLDALEAASVAGEFYYHVTQTAYGPYVDQIGRYAADGSSGWVFKVNGVSPQVGADKTTLQAGDSVLWYWAQFGVAGGPRTLVLTRSGRCYTARQQDDKGATSPAGGAVLHVGSRRAVAMPRGRACVGRHAGLLVRATLGGAVRSNALP